MRKTILISIKPYWCDLIKNGMKTVEVRKSRPKIETPFKVYIYCTHGCSFLVCGKHPLSGNGMVVGEFVCDKIEWIGQNNLAVVEDAEKALEGSCLSINEIYKYLSLPKSKDDEKYRECYGWHISELKIYDVPIELSEFRIIKPPQSWRYVEEREDNANT